MVRKCKCENTPLIDIKYRITYVEEIDCQDHSVCSTLDIGKYDILDIETTKSVKIAFKEKNIELCDKHENCSILQLHKSTRIHS